MTTLFNALEMALTAWRDIIYLHYRLATWQETCHFAFNISDWNV
jgi:hypothetical protein